MAWVAVWPVFDVAWLQEFVHHAALGDIERKKPLFVEPLVFHKAIVFNAEGVEREILAQRAEVHSAIGEDEVVLRHLARAEEFLSRF